MELNAYVSNVDLPRFVRVRQKFSREHLTTTEIIDRLREDFFLLRPVQEGQRICITCGSRGISNLCLVMETIVSLVYACGGKPFIVPAMGSHGGSTAEGQRSILESLGITENSMGCPILSSMETVKIAETDGLPVYIDRNAAEADGIIVVNRVKMHTSFRGIVESGLLKMMAVGLGKQTGADIVHAGGENDLERRILRIGSTVLSNSNVVLGIALLENAFDQTFEIRTFPNNRILKEEPSLLLQAKERMGKIFIKECDILIVRKIGKNYSGAGADPNIVGRCANPNLKGGIKCKRMAFFDLSDESHGNATGIGRADIVSRKLYEKMVFEETYPNFLACNTPDTFKIPVVFDNDKAVLQAAILTCVGIDRKRPRILMIEDSLEIEYLLASEAMIPEIEQNEHMEIVSSCFSAEFDAQGGLLTRIIP